MTKNPYADQSPAQVRRLIREGTITGQTSGMCEGFAQANLCVLPREYAYDFLLFTQRNPRSCPVLEVTDTGSRSLRMTAKDADIARDFPKYRIYENGILCGEYTDVSDFWRNDFVSFLIGCSFSFEAALMEADFGFARRTVMYMLKDFCQRNFIIKDKQGNYEKVQK